MLKLTLACGFAAGLLIACSPAAPKKTEESKISKETKRIEAPVRAERPDSDTSLDLPPNARMKFAAAKALIIQRGQPSQLGGTCETLPDVKGYKLSCRDAINDMAKAAVFTVSSCDTGASESEGSVVCNGLVETTIGSAQVNAAFQKTAGRWKGQGVKIVEGSWTPK